MSKISLTEAKELLKEITLVDVFASLVSNDILEDIIKLQTCVNLTHKIYKAEQHFNINDIVHQINLLKIKEQYYTPENAVFYYKELITQEIKDSNRDIWVDICSDISNLENKLDEISKHIYIEVD